MPDALKPQQSHMLHLRSNAERVIQARQRKSPSHRDFKISRVVQRKPMLYA